MELHVSRRTLAVATTALAVLATAAPVLALSPIKPYAVPTAGSPYLTQAVLSVGEQVPETSNPAKRFQMVGIPDGLGAYRFIAPREADDRVVVYMNHELTGTTLSEPVIGDPLNRGAFVSKLNLDGKGNVLSGERAYDTIYNENVLVGPAPEVGNATRAFSRFCSGHLAGPDDGLDRWIYFTNEEEGTPANTFDGKGGLAVAIFDNELHTLPRLGRFAWENSVLQPNKGGNRTLIMSMEDGPTDLNPANENSQLYMYVGTRDKKSPTVLGRNGLDNGELYVAVPTNPANADELAVQTGTIGLKWVLIPSAGLLDEAQLDAASDAVGAFRLVRPEDGIFGDDTWLFDVQAHSPTAAPAANTVEDGQLLVLFPNPFGRR